MLRIVFKIYGWFAHLEYIPHSQTLSTDNSMAPEQEDPAQAS